MDTNIMSLNYLLGWVEYTTNVKTEYRNTAKYLITRCIGWFDYYLTIFVSSIMMKIMWANRDESLINWDTSRVLTIRLIENNIDLILEKLEIKDHNFVIGLTTYIDNMTFASLMTSAHPHKNMIVYGNVNEDMTPQPVISIAVELLLTSVVFNKKVYQKKVIAALVHELQHYKQLVKYGEEEMVQKVALVGTPEYASNDLENDANEVSRTFMLLYGRKIKYEA